MVLRHRHNVSCSCLGKKICPLIGIEFLRLEHRNKVFITKILVRTVGLHMVVKFPGSLYIHIPGIPLVGIGRNAVDSEMDKDSEPGILIPLWNPVI